MRKKKAIIADMDGTTSDISRRLQQAGEVAVFKTVKWWNAFFQSEWIKLDKPVGYSQVVLNAYKDAGYIIIYLSGRRDTLVGASREWNRNWGFPKGIEDFRPKGSTKTFKRNAIKRLMKKYNVEVAFDNEKRMVNLFKKAGVPEVVHIKTNSSKSWKSVLEGLHLPVTVDKWLGYKGRRKFKSWKKAVKWMKKHPDMKIKNKLKPIVKCVHCGYILYRNKKKCPSCGASVGK